MMRFAALALALLSAGLCGCAHWRQERRLARLIDDGRWLSAGELGRELLRQRPQDAGLRAAIRELDLRIKAGAESADLNPKRYFYARAFIDYFQRRRYRRALEDMEQVLLFDLENTEVLEFMDKAQLRVKEEERQSRDEVQRLLAEVARLHREGQYARALRPTQQALVLAPDERSAQRWLEKIELALKQRPQRPKPAPTAPDALKAAAAEELPQADPEFLEARYHEALIAYMKQDLPRSGRILREILAYEPKNERWNRTLERIEKELPKR